MKCSGTPVRSHWVMNHLRVLWKTVPVDLWMPLPEVCIPLYNPVHAEVREQPARRWQGGIQQLLQHPMKGHLPLSCLGLQQPHRIGPDTDKAPQVPLGCDVLCHEPTNLPRAHTCEQPEEQCTVQHPVLGCQQHADQVVGQHPMGMDLWPIFDLEGLPGGCQCWS